MLRIQFAGRLDRDLHKRDEWYGDIVARRQDADVDLEFDRYLHLSLLWVLDVSIWSELFWRGRHLAALPTIIVVTDQREMFRTMAWPFAGDEFPRALGATVQRTVLDGQLPALIVGHAMADDWYVGDGINDPNVSGACVATHIQHVIQLDPSIKGLAVIPPGHEARRHAPGEPWRVEPYEMPE